MSLEIYEWSRVMILGKLIKRRYAYTVGLFLSSLHLSSRHLKTKRALIMLYRRHLIKKQFQYHYGISMQGATLTVIKSCRIYSPSSSFISCQLFNVRFLQVLVSRRPASAISLCTCSADDIKRFTSS